MLSQWHLCYAIPTQNVEPQKNNGRVMQSVKNKRSITVITRIIAVGLSVWLGTANALQLYDGQSFRYDINPDGSLATGSLSAYDQSYRLRVNDTTYQGNIVDLGYEGREAHTSVFVEPNSGLQVERRVYVARYANYARYTEILRNPTSVSVSVDVEVFGGLGSANTTLTLADQGQYLITDDSSASTPTGMPTLLHYHSQTSNANDRRIVATHQLENGRLSWIYPDVTVPGDSQVRLVYFVAQSHDFSSADVVAKRVFFNASNLYDGIDSQGLSEILNFIAPQASPSSDFSAATALSLDEQRYSSLTSDSPLSHWRAASPAGYYQFKLDAGQRLSIRASAAYNTMLYLFDDVTGQNLLAWNDNAHALTHNAHLLFTAPATQVYYLEVTPYNATDLGDYALITQSVDISNQRPQSYAIVTEYGTTSTTLDQVTLIDFSTDLDGQIVERCWLFGDGNPQTCSDSQRMQHRYEQAGQYQVGLTLRDDQGGLAQRNTIVSLAAEYDGVEMPLSSSVQGELSSSDDFSSIRAETYADEYVIKDVVAGNALVIEMRSDEVDSYLYLYDRYRNLIRQDDNGGTEQNARIDYTPAENGDLLIIASSVDSKDSGLYTLQVNRAQNVATADIDLDAVSVFGNPLQRLFIARLPAGFTPNFFQWDFGDSSSVVTTDRATVQHQYNQGGNYSVTLTAQDTRVADAEPVTVTQVFNIDESTVSLSANFSMTPLLGEAPLRVFFTNQSQSSRTGDSLQYLWRFGDGQVSTEREPRHTYTQEGVYYVTLQVYSSSTGVNSSFSLPVNVIDRSTPTIAVSSPKRNRPQVLMAGIDPILLDLTDTEFEVFAIVRPGDEAVQNVRLVQDDNTVRLVLQHVATYPNGDQRYAAIFPFATGIFPVTTFGDLWGAAAGQFRLRVQDQSDKFHLFPTLEIGNITPSRVSNQALLVPPTRLSGIRRTYPQVVGAGFDPTLVDNTEAGFTIKAIVRTGLAPIRSVTLARNGDDFSLPMVYQEALPNGDTVYAATLTYPAGTLRSSTDVNDELGQLFGSNEGQYHIVAVDMQAREHRFPEFKIGNFPAQ